MCEFLSDVKCSRTRVAICQNSPMFISDGKVWCNTVKNTMFSCIFENRKMQQSLIALKCNNHLSSNGARGKFGEHPRS